MNLREALGRLAPRTRLYLATCVYGLAGGGVAVVFHQGIHLLYSHTFEAWARESPDTFLWRTLVLMVGVALAVGLLVGKWCPQARGSGIPQLKLAYWKEFGWSSPKIVLTKFVAGVLSIGGGMSLGREGPSVQLAGTLGSAIATRLGVAKSRHRMPAAAGAAAGLAAAFNTPLAAVTFVLEEIIGDLNSRFLGNVLVASVLGALVAHGLLGAQPAFQMSAMDQPGWKVWALTPWVAVCATLAGVLFQWSCLKLRGWSITQKRLPAWLLPLPAAFMTWAIGALVWTHTGRLGVFSLGYEDLSDALAGDLGWQLALVLLGAKLLATVICYGMSGCGGVFAPTLFFGGMAGLAAAGLASLVFPLQNADMVVLAVVGMCSCLGAVVRAPVTGILILFEMTHQFSLVLPLMLGALVSQSISRRMLKTSFYEAVLEQDGHVLHRIIPPRDLESWHQLPASAVASFQPVSLPDLAPATLRDTLASHPYSLFPVVLDGNVAGVVTRQAMEDALRHGTPPPTVAAVTVQPHETIGSIQAQFLHASVPLILVCDDRKALLGLITPHDLLRAQVAFGTTLAA